MRNVLQGGCCCEYTQLNKVLLNVILCALFYFYMGSRQLKAHRWLPHISFGAACVWARVRVVPQASVVWCTSASTLASLLQTGPSSETMPSTLEEGRIYAVHPAWQGCTDLSLLSGLSNLQAVQQVLSSLLTMHAEPRFVLTMYQWAESGQNFPGLGFSCVDPRSILPTDGTHGKGIRAGTEPVPHGSKLLPS